MLKVTNLGKTFNDQGSLVTALNKVNLSVGNGDFVSIVGASGSGKSTLLALLGALERPSDGRIEMDGTDITKLVDRKLIDYRCRKIGFVFQNYNLIPNLTAIENVMLPMEFCGVNKPQRKQRAIELLDQVDLGSNKHHRKPGRLSGGEQQRVAIARALANKPAMVLADEPTGNLDSKTGKMVFDLLHSLSRQFKTTVIVVTHDLAIAGKTDKKFTIEDGKLSGR
ncbi:ABC transporter ATP-binding protein [Candidatus Saccharibacteria bacterium]|nr:ABC transporter ATP-binding protein [Candidatus Saccharibacteria bacterium]